MLNPPYPVLDDLLEKMGQASRHLSEIEASEGAAGNITVCLRWPIEVRTRFPVFEKVELPQAVPELAGATFIVSGSGLRLREIIDEPVAHLACLVVNEYCAEAAARYEYINLSVGEIAQGLTIEEIREICTTFNVQQNIF